MRDDSRRGAYSISTIACSHERFCLRDEVPSVWLSDKMTALSPPPGFGVPLQQPLPQSQVEVPKRSTSKRVSWATGESLCQVRLFVAEDAPAMSGCAQDQLQAKQTRNLHIFNSAVLGPVPDAPPGFGGVAVRSLPDRIALAAVIPQITWRPPSTVYLDPTWHVMAGGGSLETGLQKQREVRILEAVYPRSSSIPESPAEPLEAEEPYNDSSTPQIPLVPLEEEDPLEASDTSSLSVGPRFLSQGLSGQVGGGQTMSRASGRLEKVKQYIGDNNAMPVQEISTGREDLVWRNAIAGPTARPSLIDFSCDVMSGRPLAAGPVTEFHTGSNKNGVQPDVAAAAAAAFAALSKSQEMGSMIDNELLIQILSDPSLIHSLTSKPPFAITNSNPELSSSMTLNGASTGPDKINQAQVTNGFSGRANNQWINPPSTSYMIVPGIGQEGLARISESYINAGERCQRPQGSEENCSTLPAAVGNCQLYTDLANCGRVGLGQPSWPSKSSDAPPGFGSGKANGNGSRPPGFAGKSASQPRAAPQLGATPSRPLSRLDEQYFKNLIMQHGSATGNDPGRVLDDKGNAGARPGSTYSTPEAKRWYGRERLEAGRSERNGWEQRQESERIGGGTPGVETPVRSKSRKVCIYFGTPRGCRNGDNCTFIHELGEGAKRTEKVRSSPAQVQYAKRLKVDV